MSRKPRLTEKELQLLARVATECPGETAGVVQARYVELGERQISKSTVEKKLAEWRKDGTIAPAKATLPRAPRGGRPDDLEAPWSLGVSAQPEYRITPEATGTLLAVWNYSLAIGHVLTIREAKWVARLRSAFDGRHSRIGELFAHAYEYSIRERICKILNKPIVDTVDLDADMFIKERERYVYRSLGLIPRITVPYNDREERRGEAFWGYLAWAGQVAKYIAFKHVPKAAKTVDNVKELQKLFRLTEKLPSEQDRIYAALLLFLSKGPKWDDLSAQEYLQILSELRKWVTEVISTTEPLQYEILDSEGGIKPADILSTTLLEAVGYEVNTKIATKEANHER